MIPDYKQPILLIRLPGDDKPDVKKPVTDVKALSRRQQGIKAPRDPYLRILSGSVDRLLVTHTRQFQAMVYRLSDTRRTWSITSGAGTIDAQGRYTAPTDLPENRFVTIRAASTARPDIYEERTFELMALVVSPPVVYLNVLQSYTATCGVGTTGSPVTVSKAADLYTSTVSQAAANALALAAAQAEAEAALVCTTVYLNVPQSYTATCGAGTFGTPVAVTKAAGLFSSLVSQAAANAQALAAAQAEAESLLVCRVPQLRIFADALNAQGKIRLQLWVEHWTGAANWVVTIGAVVGNLSGGNLIKPTELGTPYLAENLTFNTTQVSLDFYFESLDSRWLIGNEDGDTWLVDVTAQVTLAELSPTFIKTVTWKKYLLI